MQQISREDAEEMIANFDVMETCKSLDNCIIIISLNLSNEQTLIVHYNMRKQHKAYFLKESIISGTHN